jgi:PadR family transcriptional regulator, regulatory protein PadR
MNKEMLKGHSELLVMSFLAVKPMHGYALSQKLQEALPDSFRFGMGMIYPLLHKLEKRKLITSEWQELAGIKKRVYSLTNKGKKALAEQKKDWQLFNRGMAKILAQPL